VTDAALALALAAALALGCGDDGGARPIDAGQADASAPLFPADWAASFTEVRDCRGSADHLLNRIRVVVDDAALGPYQDRATPFPDGATALKVEYGSDDCSDSPIRFTVMVKDAARTDALGWRWQDVDADRVVTEVDGASCRTCHAACTGAGDAVGYDFTCTEP
jgi:hypothetical protein